MRSTCFRCLFFSLLARPLGQPPAEKSTNESLKTHGGGERLRVCTSAGEALPELVGNAWKARFGVDILDGVGSTETAAYLPVERARRYPIRLFGAARCRATRCGSSMRQAATFPMARSANSWSMRLRRAKATGISAAKAGELSRVTGRAPATNTFAMPTDVTRSAAAATTCSRCPASGCRRSRSRAR